MNTQSKIPNRDRASRHRCRRTAAAARYCRIRRRMTTPITPTTSGARMRRPEGVDVAIGLQPSSHRSWNGPLTISVFGGTFTRHLATASAEASGKKSRLFDFLACLDFGPAGFARAARSPCASPAASSAADRPRRRLPVDRGSRSSSARCRVPGSACGRSAFCRSDSVVFGIGSWNSYSPGSLMWMLPVK